MFKAVIFDIDGTLTKDNSWSRITSSLGGSVEQHMEAFKKWKKAEIDLKEANRQVLEIWAQGKSIKYEEIYSILKDVPFRDDTKETVQYLRDKSYMICMMTGSSELYAKIISEELGIKDWFAIAKLVWENKELIDIETTHQEKEKKVEFLQEYCKKNNLDLKECVPIGDSANDLGLFEVTGNGIAVRTEFEARELEAVAWKKIDHLSELKNIL